MARIIGGIGTSHVPTIGMAFDRGKQQDPDWNELTLRVKRGGNASRLEQARRQVAEQRKRWMPQPEDVELMRDITAAIERQEKPTSPSGRVLVDRLKALDVESSKIIDLTAFVPRDELDPLYYNAGYYIYPDGAIATEAVRSD